MCFCCYQVPHLSIARHSISNRHSEFAIKQKTALLNQADETEDESNVKLNLVNGSKENILKNQIA